MADMVSVTPYNSFIGKVPIREYIIKEMVYKTYKQIASEPEFVELSNIRSKSSLERLAKTFGITFEEVYKYAVDNSMILVGTSFFQWLLISNRKTFVAACTRSGYKDFVAESTVTVKDLKLDKPTGKRLKPKTVVVRTPQFAKMKIELAQRNNAIIMLCKERGIDIEEEQIDLGYSILLDLERSEAKLEREIERMVKRIQLIAKRKGVIEENT